MPIGHKYTGPRTIFPTRRLSVDCRDRTGLFPAPGRCPVKIGREKMQGARKGAGR